MSLRLSTELSVETQQPPWEREGIFRVLKEIRVHKTAREAKFVIPFRMIKTPPKKHKESLRKNTKWSVAKRKERTLEEICKQEIIKFMTLVNIHDILILNWYLGIRAYF